MERVESGDGQEYETAKQALAARKDAVVAFVLVIRDGGREWMVECGSAGECSDDDVEAMREMLHRTIDHVIDRGHVHEGQPS